MSKKFREALKAWMGEAYLASSGQAPGGGPSLGKYEAEELYRQAEIFLNSPEQMIGLEWIDKPVTVKGEDFTYEAQCLCSFPKTSGKVRYVVEDRGRLFIQREEQLIFKSPDATGINQQALSEAAERRNPPRLISVQWGDWLKNEGYRVQKPSGVENKRVEVMYRDGRVFDTIYPSASGLDWKHFNNSNDILYYRVEKDSG